MVQISTYVHRYISAPLEGGKAAICLLVHGRTGNIRLMEWFSKRFKIPGMSYLLIEAPYPETRDVSDEQPHFKALTGGDLSGYSWYSGENYEGLESSRKGLAKTIEEIHESGFAHEDIYWFGFSQGGVMGLDLFLRSDKRLGGLISVSGFCLEAESYPEAFGSAAKEQRILITHGSRDEIIPFEKAQETYEKLRSAGLDFDFREYSKRHAFELKKEIPELEDQLKLWSQA